MSDQTPELKLTPVSVLKAYVGGELVNLPPFGEDKPFVVRLRRPSLMSLARQGKIPNELLSTAMVLFEGKMKDKAVVNTELLQQLYDIVDLLCEASFLEPTYAELKEAGIELTDEQMVAVFNYTQAGVRGIQPFRK